MEKKNNMTLDDVMDLVNTEFMHAFFFRYFEYKVITLAAGMKDGKQQFRTKKMIGNDAYLDREATDKLFLEQFGSYDALYRDILEFKKIVKKKKIEHSYVLDVARNLAQGFPTLASDVVPHYFVNELADRSIRNPKDNFHFEYDIKTAWSSCLLGRIPVASERLNLDFDDMLNYFNGALSRNHSSEFIFTFEYRLKKRNDVTLKIGNSGIINLWDFEVADFFEKNLVSELNLIDVYAVQTERFLEIEKFIMDLYALKEAATNIIEYNYWKSHLNNFNRMLFKKSDLLHNFVIARTRARIYKAVENETGVFKFKLDSITSDTPVHNIEKLRNFNSGKIGSWRKVERHARNFSSADRIAEYDLKQGILNE